MDHLLLGHPRPRWNCRRRQRLESSRTSHSLPHQLGLQDCHRGRRARQGPHLLVEGGQGCWLLGCLCRSTFFGPSWIRELGGGAQGLREQGPASGRYFCRCRFVLLGTGASVDPSFAGQCGHLLHEWNDSAPQGRAFHPANVPIQPPQHQVCDCSSRPPTRRGHACTRSCCSQGRLARELIPRHSLRKDLTPSLQSIPLFHVTGNQSFLSFMTAGGGKVRSLPFRCRAPR